MAEFADLDRHNLMNNPKVDETVSDLCADESPFHSIPNPRPRHPHSLSVDQSINQLVND